MDKQVLLALLMDLSDRIEQDPVTGRLRIDGVITAAQANALDEGIALLSGESPSSSTARERKREFRPAPAIQLDASCLHISEPSIPDAVLCLDFGTAMSKAFAIVGDDPVGLSLGAESGYAESEFAVPSSVYVSNDGRLHFGHDAISKSDEEAGDPKDPRQRIDSPKQHLSVGDIGDLRKQILSTEQNPTGVKLSYWDLITLYLGYLNSLADNQLRKAGHVGLLRRRIARPCWDPERTEWADRALAEMSVAAQILADTFAGQWIGGQLDVSVARSALDEVNDLMGKAAIPDWLIGGSVPEPVAAGFGRVFRGIPERRAFLVVDVGAGTTDFGLFVLSQLQESKAPTIVLVSRSTNSLRVAGDRVDTILRSRLLRSHGIDPQAGEEGRLINLHLLRNIRRWKEILFRTGELTYRLPNDLSGHIALSEFETDPMIETFCNQLADELVTRLNVVDPSWISNMISRQDLQIVMTGGGSTIPPLKRLTAGRVQAHGYDVNLVASSKLPQWIESEQPQYAEAYRQLAVAIGGAAPDLPARLKEFEHFGGGGPRGPVHLERFQTRGT